MFETGGHSQEDNLEKEARRALEMWGSTSLSLRRAKGSTTDKLGAAKGCPRPLNVKLIDCKIEGKKMMVTTWMIREKAGNGR
jgi:hypothetical protein